jgi:hypothetical protein
MTALRWFWTPTESWCASRRRNSRRLLSRFWVVAEMQQKGIQFERFGFFEQDALGIWASPTGDKVAWFKDPDGNILSVSQH